MPIISSEELFSGKGWKITFDTASLPDGRMKKKGRAHRPDVVNILAFPTESTVLMLWEYRAFYGRYIWMIPSGKVDKENDPDVAAQRELREETGFRADDMKFYCMARSSDRLEARNYLYIARGLVQDPLPKEDTELMEVHEVPIVEAIDRVLADGFAHLATAYALLRYAREHGF